MDHSLKAYKQERVNTSQPLKGQYHALFHHSPISIWEEDFSKVKESFDRLRKKGVSDFSNYFNKHPEEVLNLAKKVRIIAVNKATLDLYQARNERELCQGLQIIFNKESFNIFRDELVALAHGKTEFESEAVNLTVKGEKKDILMKLVVPPGHEETLSRVFIHIVDISEIKRRKKDLRESEVKFRRIYETAYDAILLADTETGIILEVNKKAEDLIGLPAHEIIGMHFTEIHPEGDAENYKMLFKQHVNAGGFSSDNLVLINSSGDTIPVAVSTSVLKIEGKKCISALFRRLDKKGQKINNSFMNGRSLNGLTNRESEILGLISSGLSTKQMAVQLFVSERTITTHRARIMQKLNLHKTADLVRYAMNSGMVQ